MLLPQRGQRIRFQTPRSAYSTAAPPPACAASRSAEDDNVISMSILRHVDATPEEREAYLKTCGRGPSRTEDDPTSRQRGGEEGAGSDRARRGALCRDVGGRAVRPDHVGDGYGKRTSCYEYRITNRGGKGIVAMAIVNKKPQRDRRWSPRSRSRRPTRSCW